MASWREPSASSIGMPLAKPMVPSNSLFNRSNNGPAIAPDAKAAPGLRLERVTFGHHGHRVFEDLSLDFTAGRWHAVLGRSGIGKSTLLRLLGGLDEPDGGSILDDDGEPLAHRVAYMAQDDALLPWLSVLENVRLGPRLRGRRDDRTREYAGSLLERVGLHRWRDARPGALSGGMRQRVALARTLLEDRPVVLMDEPFSRLDAVTRVELQHLSATLLRDRTVVLVTHDPHEALHLGHTVTLLREGLPSRTLGFAVDGAPPRDPDTVSFASLARELRRALADVVDAGASTASSPAGSNDATIEPGVNAVEPA